jgi:predicted RNA-binding Zn-ribbon protein involved in translation (DUF1610 family)
MKKCPKCGSKNIVFHAAAHTGKYECKDCGYIGTLIIEEE